MNEFMEIVIELCERYAITNNTNIGDPEIVNGEVTYKSSITVNDTNIYMRSFVNSHGVDILFYNNETDSNVINSTHFLIIKKGIFCPFISVCLDGYAIDRRIKITRTGISFCSTQLSEVEYQIDNSEDHFLYTLSDNCPEPIVQYKYMKELQKYIGNRYISAFFNDYKQD